MPTLSANDLLKEKRYGRVGNIDISIKKNQNKDLTLIAFLHHEFSLIKLW
jgi:sporulation protein YlmC with PRC-barrel domain